MLNRRFFFGHARTWLFDGRLTQSQVSGLDGLLDEWERSHAHLDDRWLAYMLATAHHETDRAMQPVSERGGARYFRTMYDPEGARPALALRHGNTTPGDGARYRGRGFVQLTWKGNYERAGAVLGIDLVGEPDRALEPAIATRLLFEGMQRGWFTGRRLGDYFNPEREDWVGARRIINSLDKANLVASHARHYYAALSHTT